MIRCSDIAHHHSACPSVCLCLWVIALRVFWRWWCLLWMQSHGHSNCNPLEPGLSATWMTMYPWLFPLLPPNHYVNPFFYLTPTIRSYLFPQLLFHTLILFCPFLLLLPLSIFLPLSQDISAFLSQNLPSRLTLFFLLLLTVELGWPVFILIILKP